MISWLKAAIARLLTKQEAPTEATAQPTQTVGPVSQEPTARRGNRRSALTTAPVQTESKPKRSRARQTTAEASPKQERTSAKRTAIQPGQQAATPAPQTRRRAKRPAKQEA
jgi:hypothetical protein